MMIEIVNKCEIVYFLIQKCQNNDSVLVDEKRRIYGFVDEVCDLMEKVVLEFKEISNLIYYFEYDIICILEIQIGEIRVLKLGQKGLLWVIRNFIIWELLVQIWKVQNDLWYMLLQKSCEIFYYDKSCLRFEL